MTEPVTDPAPEFVSVAGLLIPLPVRDQLVAALRRKYPTVTAGLEDDPAVQQVLIYWMASTLESDATDLASGELAEAQASLEAAHASRMAEARAAARQAVAAIKRAAPPAEPTPTNPEVPA